MARSDSRSLRVGSTNYSSTGVTRHMRHRHLPSRSRSHPHSHSRPATIAHRLARRRMRTSQARVRPPLALAATAHARRHHYEHDVMAAGSEYGQSLRRRDDGDRRQPTGDSDGGVTGDSDGGRRAIDGRLGWRPTGRQRPTRPTGRRRRRKDG